MERTPTVTKPSLRGRHPVLARLPGPVLLVVALSLVGFATDRGGAFGGPSDAGATPPARSTASVPGSRPPAAGAGAGTAAGAAPPSVPAAPAGLDPATVRLVGIEHHPLRFRLRPLTGTPVAGTPAAAAPVVDVPAAAVLHVLGVDGARLWVTQLERALATGAVAEDVFTARYDGDGRLTELRRRP